MSRASRKSRGAVLALLLLALLASTVPQAEAQLPGLGLGMQFWTWKNEHLLVVFAGLWLDDIFLLELGLPVIPLEAIGLPAIGVKLYLGKIGLGTYTLRPLLGGGGLIAEIVPLMVDVFGGAELSFADFNLFVGVGLNYTIICCPGCPPDRFLALGLRRDFQWEMAPHGRSGT